MNAHPQCSQVPPCPVCESDQTRHWLGKEGYNHGRCDACGHGFVFPVPPPAQIDAYYQALNTGLSSDCSWETEAGHKLQLWRRMLVRAEQDSGKGPLLDLGCGGGQFLQLASALGWTECCGVEPSSKAVRIARSSVSFPIHEGTWTNSDLPLNHFSVIAMLDVLEHDPDPAGLLRHCLALLRPGGCLIMTVPNMHGLSLRCFGKDACVVIPPEHLSYFSAKSMRLMLLKTGFTMLRTTTCDLYLKEWLRLLPGSRKKTVASDINGTRKLHYLRWRQRLTGAVALSGISVVNWGLGISGCGDQLVATAFKPRGAENHG